MWRLYFVILLFFLNSCVKKSDYNYKKGDPNVYNNVGYDYYIENSDQFKTSPVVITNPIIPSEALPRSEELSDKEVIGEIADQKQKGVVAQDRGFTGTSRSNNQNNVQNNKPANSVIISKNPSFVDPSLDPPMQSPKKEENFVEQEPAISPIQPIDKNNTSSDNQSLNKQTYQYNNTDNNQDISVENMDNKFIEPSPYNQQPITAAPEVNYYRNRSGYTNSNSENFYNPYGNSGDPNISSPNSANSQKY